MHNPDIPGLSDCKVTTDVNKEEKVMRLKKIVSLLLATVMVIGVTACGKSETETAAETPAAKTTEAAETTESAQAADPLGKYDETVEIDMVVRTNDNIEKNLLEANGWTWEDNIWTQHYLDQLNVKINWKWIAKGDEEYNTKVNMMLASGDLPDFFLVNSIQLKQLVDADMVEDLTSYYEQYAADLTKSITAESGSAPFAAAMFDGKLYGIPKIYPSYDRAKFLYVRQDWLDKLGLEVPTTMDELIDVAIAFSTQDPDGNGIDDTYGFALTKNLIDGGHEIKGFSYGYGATPDQWIEKDGQLVYGGIQPEMKEALAGLQRLYTSGAIDPEFGVKDYEKVTSDFNAGTLGMTYGEHWVMVNIDKLMHVDENAEVLCYKLPSIDGSDPTCWMDLGTSQWLVARKGTEHPEIAVKMLNLVTETQYGDLFTTELQQNSDLSPLFIVREENNLISFRAMREYFINGKPFDEIAWNDGNGQKGEEKWLEEDGCALYMTKGDREQYGWAHIYAPIDGANMPILEYYIENDVTKINRFIGAPTETMGEKKATLDEIQVTAFTKIIQGADLSEFDKFVEDWKKNGGDQITQEVNEWYAGVADKNY